MWYLVRIMWEYGSDHISVLCVSRHGDDLIVTPFAQVDIVHTQNDSVVCVYSVNIPISEV